MADKFPTNIPQIYNVNKNNIQDLIYPLIIKQNIGAGGVGTFLMLNKFMFMIYYQKYHKNNNIFQEYINGEYEYSGHFLCIDGIIKCGLVMREKYGNRYIKKGCFKKFEIISNFVTTLFKDILYDLQYTGGCCIDFKYIDNCIKIFEINPRFGGTIIHHNLLQDFLQYLE
jgi:carbamoylphosphate synthase large subunit